jgi:oligopeptide transport system permease protein
MSDINNRIRNILTKEDFEPIKKAELEGDLIVRPVVNYWPDVLRRLMKDRMAVFCLVVILAMILLSVFVPIFSPYSFDQTDLLKSNHSPNSQNWFGTDRVGRDLFTRVWYGSRVSLGIGFVGAILPYLIGMLVGGVSGWFGGWIDMLIMRIIDIGLCIPPMIYFILIIVYFGGGPFSMILAFAIMGWMGAARGFRGRVLQFKNREFNLAARTLGASPMRIVFKHILPNITGNLVVGLTAAIPAAIFMEAGLSYIGLGVEPPLTSLGKLSADGSLVFRTYPYQLFIPGTVISLIIFSFFMFGNALRDALDPRLRDLPAKERRRLRK